MSPPHVHLTTERLVLRGSRPPTSTPSCSSTPTLPSCATSAPGHRRRGTRRGRCSTRGCGRRAAWGRGLASEGGRALIDTAFRTTSTQRITAETMVVNARSRAVMQRCGMRPVRSFRADWPVPIPGDEQGDVEYAITRAQWEDLRAQTAATPRPGPPGA